MFRKCTAAYYKTIQMHPNQKSFMLTRHPVLHDMLPIHDIKRGEAFPSSPVLSHVRFFLFPKIEFSTNLPIFLSSPCLVVGNPVFLLIFCFAAVIPTALFQEKLNPRISYALQYHVTHKSYSSPKQHIKYVPAQIEDYA